MYVFGVTGVFPDGKTYAFAFGVWFGLMELIPFVGPFLGALPPLLVALFQDPLTAVWLGIFFVGAAAARGPRRRALHLRPHAADQPAAGDLRAAARRRGLRLPRRAAVAADRGDGARDGGLPAPPPGAGAVGDAGPLLAAAPPARAAAGARTCADCGAAAASSDTFCRDVRRGAGARGSSLPPVSDGAALEARDVTRRFGAREALRGVSFGVAPGETLAIIGPNGAGKTTLLSILGGVLAPTERLGRRATPRDVGWVPAAAGGLREAHGRREPGAVRAAGARRGPARGRRPDARRRPGCASAPATSSGRCRAATASA